MVETELETELESESESEAVAEAVVAVVGAEDRPDIADSVAVGSTAWVGQLVDVVEWVERFGLTFLRL